MRSGVIRVCRPHMRPTRPTTAPHLPHVRPTRMVQARSSFPSRMGIRAAIADKLQQARTWQDVQQILNQYGDYLTPAEIQQIVAAAPGMSPTRAPPNAQQPIPRQQRSMPRGRAQPRQFSSPGAAAAEAQARRAAAAAEAQRRQAAAAQQAAQEQQAYQDMMNKLAQITRQQLPQLKNTQEAPRLADTAYALAHAGALNEDLALELLQHTAEQAAQGQLDVQGLADVLAALGKSRFRPTPAVVNQLLRDVDPVSRCTSSQELSALLRGLASLGYQPDQTFVESVMQSLNQRQAEAQAAASAAAAQQASRQAAARQSDQGRSRARSPGRPAGSPGTTAEEDEDEQQRVVEREQEEARHVAAAVQALQRMGASRQAAQLKATYLKDLQTRAAHRLQAQQAQEGERVAAQQRAEQERLQQQRAEQQRLQQQRAEQQKLEQQRLEQQRAEQQRQEQQRQEAMQAAVRKAIEESRTWQKLQTILYSYPQWLGPQELTFLLARLTSVLGSSSVTLTWRDRAELNEMLQAWGSQLAEAVEARGIEPAQLVTCLQAMIAIKWLDQELLGFLLRESKKRLADFSGLQLVGVMQALAVAGLRPSQAFLEAFLQESAGKLAGCSAVEMRDLAASLYRLNIQPGAAWMLAYLGALQANESKLSMEEASACLEAAAALDAPLVQRWYAGLVDSRRAQERQQQVPQQQPRDTSRATSPSTTTTTSKAASTSRPAQLKPALTSISDELLPDVLDSPLETDSDSGSDVAGASRATGTGASPAGNRPSRTKAGAAQATSSNAPVTDSTLDPPDSIYNSLPVDVQSVDFDEETASAGSLQLPDDFLLDQLRPFNSVDSQPEEVEAEVVPSQPLTPAQLKAFRSVLLERLELAEDSETQSRDRIDAAQTRTENAAIQLASVRSQLDTLQADYDRVKARHQNEKDELSTKVKLDVFGRLLPLLDNFDRAAASLKTSSPGEEAVAAAYQTVPQQIQELLQSAGVEEVPGAGQPFDPAVHDAIMQEYNADVPDGTVLLVLQKGFKAGDKLLRPALVKVSTA